MEKAVAAGTPQDTIKKATSSEFLQACLRRAKLDDDLVADTCDACEMNELDALELGGGDLSDADAADKLFLMQDEAVSILAICRRECLRIGVNFGDGGVYEPGPEDDNYNDTGVAEPAQVSTPANYLANGQLVHQNGDVSPSPQSPREPSPTTSPAVHQTPNHVDLPKEDHVGSNGHADHDDPADQDDPINCHFLVKPPAHLPLNSQKPRKLAASIKSSPGFPTSTSMTTPSSAKANVTPTTVVRSISTAPKPAVSAPKSSTRTSLANGSAASPAVSSKYTAFGSKLSTTKPRAASATPNSKSLPSYARSTASMKARVEDPTPSSPSADASADIDLGMPPLQQTVSPVKGAHAKKPVKKSAFANISSSLLRPTKAFLAWTKKNTEEADSTAHRQGMNGDSPVLRSSTKGPIGTGSRTFTPPGRKERTLTEIKTAKAAGVPLSSVEQVLLKAHEESGGGFKARPVPKTSARTPTTPASNGFSRNLSASVNLSATSKARISSTRASMPLQQPFILASEERHRKAQEDLARKVEEKRRQEEAMNKPFKATPVPGRKQPTTPLSTYTGQAMKTPSSAVTMPRGLFSFGRKGDRKVEETVDTYYQRYASCRSSAAALSTSPARVLQVQVQKYVVPSGVFGLTVQPSIDAVTEDLIRVHPYVHSEKDYLVCFKGHLSNTWELQQRVHQWRESRSDTTNNSDGSVDISSMTTMLIMELYRNSEGCNKLLLSELQGQYAFVMYDGERKSVLAARDPSGAENLYYKDGEDGSVAWTNSLEHLPIGEDPSDWVEFPPGHFMSGKVSSLQQFALTREQLLDRERAEEAAELEDSSSDESIHGSSPNLMSRLSKSKSKSKTWGN
eukprot:gene14268-20242_t